MRKREVHEEEIVAAEGLLKQVNKSGEIKPVNIKDVAEEMQFPGPGRSEVLLAKVVETFCNSVDGKVPVTRKNTMGPSNGSG